MIQRPAKYRKLRRAHVIVCAAIAALAILFGIYVFEEEIADGNVGSIVEGKKQEYRN